jgi:hypothetical protein
MKRQYHFVRGMASLFTFRMQMRSLYQVRGASDKEFFTAQSPEIIKTKRWFHGRMESPASLSDAVCVSTAKPPRLQASRCIFAVT